MNERRIQSIYEKKVRASAHEHSREELSEISEHSHRVPPSSRIHTKTLLEKISSGCLWAAVFFVSIFFVPIPGLLLETSKGALLGILILAAFCLWIFSSLRALRFSFPKSFVWVGLVLLVFSAFLSSLVSSSWSYALFGRGIQTDTFLFTVIFSLLAFLSARYFERKHVQVFFFAFFLLFLLLTLFHALRLIFGASFLSLGYFTGAYQTIFGGWYDVPVFFGFSVLVGLCLQQFFWKKSALQIAASLMVVISLIALAVFSLPVVLWLLVFFSAVLLLTGLSQEGVSIPFLFSWLVKKREHTPKTKQGIFLRSVFFPAFVFLFSIIFLVFGPRINPALSHLTGMDSTAQARPSWKTTVQISGDVAHTGITHALFGTGPGTFFKDWAQYKSQAVNLTPWWNVDFQSAVSFFGTRGITQGWLGIFSLLVLLAGMIYEGKRGFFSRALSSSGKKMFLTLYLMVWYLWGVLLFYTPGLAVTALAFALLGMLIAFLGQEQIVKLSQCEFSVPGKTKTAFTGILVVLLIVSLGGIYLTVQKYRAAVAFQKGTTAYTQNKNLAEARAEISKAAKLDKVDAYYRGLSEISVMQMQQIEQQASASGKSVDMDNFQKIFEQAITDAQTAKDLDPTNYQNWLFLGNLYRFFASLHVSGAYEASNAFYSHVFTFSPYSPEAYLDMARLERTQNNTAQAQTYLKNALREKSNYADAYVEQASLQIALNDTQGAADSLAHAASLVQNDPTLWFQLGFLEYQNGEYDMAEKALLQSIALVPTYANAEYYLGLSYERLGEHQQAVSIFENLQKMNPDSADVKNILGDLKAGKSPFTHAAVNSTESIPNSTESSASGTSQVKKP